MSRRKRSSLLVAIVLAVLAALSGLYCIGYVVRGRGDKVFESIWIRRFETETECLLFAPLVRLESGLLQHIVVVCQPDGSHFATYQQFRSIPDPFSIPASSLPNPTSLQP